MLQIQDGEENSEYTLHTYMYRFDWPYVTSDGTLQISNKNLVLIALPQRVGSPSNILDQNLLPSFDLTISQNLLFSFSWLPIYTCADLLKCQDILIRAYYNYLMLINVSPPQNPPGFQYLYYEQSNTEQTSEYVLNYKESRLHTSLKLDILPNPTCDILKEDPHVQIHIGDYIVFSSERDLRGVQSKTLAFLLSFILQKLCRL
jgi:hypothetical protein